MRNLLIALLAFLCVAPTMAITEEDDAKKALNDAQRYAKAGEYAKALERHEWFHNNALRIRPSFYGVRLSYALVYWRQLGEKYPPALNSLRAVRDAGVRDLESGGANEDMCHDVSSINDEIGEADVTVNLFKSLHQTNPQLANRCFPALRKTLLDKGEIALFTAYAGDLESYLKEQIKQHNTIAKYMKSRGQPGGDETTKIQNQRLISTALSLIDIAQKNGDSATALKLRSLAIEVVDDPRLQSIRK
jgi:hypothetical protein